MMNNMAFTLKASTEYCDLLCFAFKYYLDHQDFSDFCDDYPDSVEQVYECLKCSQFHHEGKYFFIRSFFHEDDFYIFCDVIHFIINNCALDNSSLARFYIMFNKFCADPEGQVISLL